MPKAVFTRGDDPETFIMVDVDELDPTEFRGGISVLVNGGGFAVTTQNAFDTFAKMVPTLLANDIDELDMGISLLKRLRAQLIEMAFQQGESVDVKDLKRRARHVEEELIAETIAKVPWVDCFEEGRLYWRGPLEEHISANDHDGNMTPEEPGQLRALKVNEKMRVGDTTCTDYLIVRIHDREAGLKGFFIRDSRSDD